MKTLEVYRREGELWVVAGSFGDDEEIAPPPFTEVPLDLGALWRVPGASR